MGRLAEAAGVTSLAALYAGTGALGALLPASTHPGVALVGAALAVAVPAALLRRPFKSLATALLGWSIALVGVAAALPGRAERFAWPVHAAVVRIAPRPAPSTTAATSLTAPVSTPATMTAASTPVAPSASSLQREGTAQIDVKLVGPDLPDPPATALRYATAWPERGGIMIALADRPVTCPGHHGGADIVVTCLIPPSLDGRFYADTEIATQCAISPWVRDVDLAPGETFVRVKAWSPVADAPIEGRIRIARALPTGKLKRRLVGEGTFETTLCDGRYRRPHTSGADPPLARYVPGWQAPAPTSGEVTGKVFDAPFTARDVGATLRKLEDGRTILDRVSFAEAGTDACDARRGRVVTVVPYDAIGEPTKGPRPAAAHGAGRTTQPEDTVWPYAPGYAPGVLEVTRFGPDVVEGRVTAWAAPLDRPRANEVSGQFHARICPVTP